MILRFLRSVAFLLILAACQLAGVSSGSAQTAPVTPSSDKVDRFLELLADQEVRDWLSKQVAAAPPVTVPAVQPAPSDAGNADRTMVSSGLAQVKAHIERMLAAIPALPGQFSTARGVLERELQDRSLLGVTAIIAVFIAAGFLAFKLVFRMTRPFRLWLISLSKDTPQGRAKKIGSRILYSTVLLAAFVVGSAGAFLVFEWPPLLREIVLDYLTVAIVIWAARMYTYGTLVPSSMNVAHAAEVRAFPVADATADHWTKWIVVIVAWFMVAGATLTLLPTLGFTHDGILVLALPVDLVLLCLILLAVWLRPRSVGEDFHPRVGHTGVTWLLTAYFVGLWMLRLFGFWTVFWFAFAAVTLPFAIVMAHKAVRFVLRPGTEETGGHIIAPVLVAVIDRAIRMALILVAFFLLARAWGLDMRSMENNDPTTTLVLRALLNTLVIVLAADFGWSIIKALIERKLGGGPAEPDADDHGMPDAQQARLRTLLPIIQNIMFAVIVVMAVLMVLASIGIQIGPLIAGAGVVGVAVGFGAQTLVKDVISGVFYLLDDAFRVGEYISSGKYMGTVESFSLRSIKLRHHRGPLYTIPFGELGAVQNQSRDWTTDKFNITVGYDTDLEFARKLIKKIGIELAADPEYAPWVIEPIKMQGVQGFGDYGIDLRMKMTTKPGHAFSMKRKFFVRVRQAFKENNIVIPGPSVQIHQEGLTDSQAAAQAHVALRKKQADAAAAAGEGGG